MIKSIKIYAIVDGLGNPVLFLLSSSQIRDIKIAISLLETRKIHSNHIITIKHMIQKKFKINHTT